MAAPHRSSIPRYSGSKRSVAAEHTPQRAKSSESIEAKDKKSLIGITIAGVRSPLSEKDLPSCGSSTSSRLLGREKNGLPTIGRGRRSSTLTKNGKKGLSDAGFGTRGIEKPPHVMAPKGRALQASTLGEANYQKLSQINGKKETSIKTAKRSVMPVHEYTIKPIVPAARAELLDVGRAMHRDQFASRVKKLFDPEKEAAIQAIESGIYIGWRCHGADFDCIRVGAESRCFCGHVLHQHESFTSMQKENLKCLFDGCKCKKYAFVPSRPEEIGEWWLQKRRGFDVAKWRAKCRCKHDHEQHNPNSNRKCNAKGCSCFAFDSNFLCAACDKHWEEHDTYFDDLNSRQEKGLPYGEAYIPFNELPQLRNIVLTGNEDDSSKYDAIKNGRYAIPRQEPTELALKLQGKKPY